MVIEPEDKVENWLKKIEDTMINSLRVLAVKSYQEYPLDSILKREEWIFADYPA